MRKTVEKTLGDKAYTFRQFNTTESLTVLSKLTKIVGEPLIMAMGAFGIKPPAKPVELVNGLPPPVSESFPKEDEKEKFSPKKMLDKLNVEGLSKALGVLLQRMDEDEVIYVVKKLATNGVTCDGNEVNFDEHYAGGLGHLFEVVGAAIEVQYGNFFDAVTAGVSKAVGVKAPSTPAT